MTTSIGTTEDLDPIGPNDALPREEDPAWMESTSDLVMKVAFASIGMFVVGTVLAGLVFDSWGAGAAIGAFCAVWGGPGFGLMLACSQHSLRLDEEHAIRSEFEEMELSSEHPDLRHLVGHPAHG